jgi:G8 domain
MGRSCVEWVVYVSILAYAATSHKLGSKDVPPNLPLPPLRGPQPPEQSLSQPNQSSPNAQGAISAGLSPVPSQQADAGAPSYSVPSPSQADQAPSPSSPPVEYVFQLGVKGSISVPNCQFPSTFPPLNQWQRWSSPATWGPAGPPGPDDTATIYCGQFVLFDMPLAPGGGPSVMLRFLNVTGVLMFADDNAIGDLHLAAQFIIVHGLLLIGSPDNHFRLVPFQS